MTRILHMSDLHFHVPESGAAQYHYWRTPKPSGSLNSALGQSIPTLAEAIAATLKQGKIDAIAITGDITWRATRDEFDYAIDEIKRLRSALEVPQEHVLLIPGNHDADWAAATNRRFNEFKRAFKQVTGEMPLPELLQDITLKDGNGDVICQLIGVNSASIESDKNAGMGMIGEGAIAAATVKLTDRRTDRPFVRIACLHHHLLPVAYVERDYFKDLPEGQLPRTSVSLDAKSALTQFSSAGVVLILHGHQHQPSLASYKTLDPLKDGAEDEGSSLIWVSGSGSCGVVSSHLGDAQTRHFQVLNIERDSEHGIVCSIEAYTQSTEPASTFAHRATRKLTLLPTRKYISPSEIPASNEEPSDRPRPTAHIPIYANLRHSSDWFSEFEDSINSPRLDSKMLYFGPGLARYWIEIGSNFQRLRDVREVFLRDKERILEPISASAVSIVDLGIGDFGKGRLVLEHFLDRDDCERLNFVGVDISHDMLSMAFQRLLNRPDPDFLLERISKKKGRFIGINAEFRHLHEYTELINDGGQNVFLLLGNTLGNEPNEFTTLASIRKAMRSHDLLLLELQLKEEVALTEQELTHKLLNSAWKQFCTGPLAAVGCDLDAVELFTRVDRDEASARRIDAITYRHICKIKRRVTLRHPALRERSLEVHPEEITVYLVRKYSETGVEDLLRRAGFRILRPPAVTPGRGTDPRFMFITAERDETSSTRA